MYICMTTTSFTFLSQCIVVCDSFSYSHWFSLNSQERYKADISLAIQLLQCKPDSFVPQKVSSVSYPLSVIRYRLSSHPIFIMLNAKNRIIHLWSYFCCQLPIDIQSKVSAYMRLETNSHSDSECSNSGVGLATMASYKVLPVSDSPPPAPCPFPPTAMVYSMRGLGKCQQTMLILFPFDFIIVIRFTFNQFEFLLFKLQFYFKLFISQPQFVILSSELNSIIGLIIIYCIPYVNRDSCLLYKN